MRMPALFMRMSILPNSAMARLTTISTSLFFVTSACTPATVRPVSPAIFSADTAIASPLMSQPSTLQPFRANSRATAKPMPWAAPVTMADFPSSSFTMSTPPAIPGRIATPGRNAPPSPR